jgi:replication-associated recombination protein RarA
MPLVSQGNSVDSKHEEVVVINESNERESSMSRQRNTLLDQIHKFNFEQQEIAKLMQMNQTKISEEAYRSVI